MQKASFILISLIFIFLVGCVSNTKDINIQKIKHKNEHGFTEFQYYLRDKKKVNMGLFLVYSLDIMIKTKFHIVFSKHEHIKMGKRASDLDMLNNTWQGPVPN